MGLVNVLTPETDKQIGEAALSIAQFFAACTVLVQNINAMIMKAKG